MDGDHNEMGTVHEENAQVGLGTLNNLDLNVDQNCDSANIALPSGSASGLSSESALNANIVLGIGTKFESDDLAYRFYNKYAKLLGFNVRKDWINRSKKHGQVMTRKFTCSKQGYRRKHTKNYDGKRHRKETRTGCLAHMIITRQRDGRYLVTHFEAQHNHDNINPSDANLLNLQNELSDAQAVEPDLNNGLGSKSKLALDMMNKKIDARESLYQLSMNYDNSLNSERERDMNDGEAGQLLGYFQRQHFENPTFFYAMQLDVDDKVSNLFWADDNMVVDYDHFGDVICLDTTCKTKGDLRPFVQFLGVNHHKQVLIFGAAFLYDNTIESFKWLFRTFINAMSGKKPKAIFTEQDAVIIEAVNTVLPGTNHCTCVWQMYENTLKHLSRAARDAESFANDLRSSIYDPKNEEEFTHAWEAMLEKYNLQQNEWLRWMYREREKWAVVFGRNTFFVDKGFHLGEIMSCKFRSYLNYDNGVLQFFKHFERAVDEQRYKEIEASDEMSRCSPRLMCNVVLLKNASDVYTPRAFEVFQRGYEESLNNVVNQRSGNGSLFEYEVNTFGHTRRYRVKFDLTDDKVVCSCMKFEYVGFLCSHALKVLDHRNIKVVPSRYILKRWEKNARFGNLREITQCKMQDNPKMVVASYYKDLCHRLLKLSARASESVEAYQFAARQLDEVMEGVEKILTLKDEEAPVITSGSIDANASESEPAEIFPNGHATEDLDGVNRVNIEKDRRATPDNSPRTTMDCNGTDSNAILNVEVSPNTVVPISSPSHTYVSSQSAIPNAILQGLYSYDANQVVQCMYEQPNLVLDHQSNTNMIQPPNCFSNQQDSSAQSRLLQESVIQSTYQESMLSSNQMQEGMMDLDIQNPRSFSFLPYDHRYRNSDSAQREELG